MRKIMLFFSLLAAATLAACGQVAAPAATPTATLAPTGTAAPQPTSSGTVDAAASCTQVSLLPTTGPTEASLFGPVTEQDWAQGPADARITIVEYSDFQ